MTIYRRDNGDPVRVDQLTMLLYAQNSLLRSCLSDSYTLRHLRQRCQASLYDRIVVVAFALVLCQKHGVPQSMCMMAAMSLLIAEYMIKTKYGVSSGTYSSTAEPPADSRI